MNNKSGSERDQLLDTLKLAASCNLNVFETADAILHEFKFHDLQKLCEEQKGEIAYLKKFIADECAKADIYYCEKHHGEIGELKKENKRLNSIVRDSVPCQIVKQMESQLAEQKEEIEALEERIENLNDLAVIAEGKLATQTERVRVMREALEKIDCCSYQVRHDNCPKDIAKQALNQERLGDGK